MRGPRSAAVASKPAPVSVELPPKTKSSRRAGRRLLAALVLVAATVAAALAYVAVPVAGDLIAARDVLTLHPSDVEASDLARARRHLARARARLHSVPARILGPVPVLGVQVDVVRSLVDTAVPVLDSELTLVEAIDGIKEDGIAAEGAVDLAVVGRIESALGSTVDALRALEREAARSSEMLLLTPAVAGLDEITQQIGSLRMGAEDGLELLEIVPPVLGSDGPRTYLVLLMNNAELRGAGGILAAVGTMRVSDGRIDVGRFYNIDDLKTQPLMTVPAPREYVRRFSTYAANSTLWVNTTFSPDFPDVALVASRLFERVTGVKTDGVIGIDPRGLALAMPASASVPVPRRDEPLTADTFAPFVYSESYGLYRDQDYRKEVVIDAGLQVFRSILDKTWDEYEELEEIGDAVAGAHIRFVSFRNEEEAVLSARGATGELAPPERDGLFVVSQNFGSGGEEGNKLDYWAERRISHRCDIEPDGAARCVSGLDIHNVTPSGLVRYVAGHPYGLLSNYVEFFVSSAATVTAVEIQGEPTHFWEDEQAGRKVVGVYLEAARGRHVTATVKYDLGAGRAYSLLAVPQPLARDASLRIRLRVPPGWVVDGPGSMKAGAHEFEGPFREPVTLRASAT